MNDTSIVAFIAAQQGLVEQPVIVSTPTCGMCMRAKRLLDSNGVLYQDINLLEHQNLKEYLLAVGYQQLPIMVDPVSGTVSVGEEAVQLAHTIVARLEAQNSQPDVDDMHVWNGIS